MSAPRIVIAGATGYLGTRLRRHLPGDRIAGVVVRRLLPELPGVKWAMGPAAIEPIDR